MDELEIQTFLAVINSGSISAAAKNLYLTQPAISRRIRILEESLGYPLIVRGQGERSITLTEQGKAFAGYAEKLSSLFKDVHQLSGSGGQNQVHLAAPAVIAARDIALAIRRYCQLHPQSSFVLHTRHSYSAASGVNSGSLDLAIVTRLTHVSKLSYAPISSEPYRLVSHCRCLPNLSELHPRNLDPALEVRMPWDLAYESWHSYWFGERALPFIKADRLSAVSVFLRESEGWSLLPETIATKICQSPDFILRSLQEPPSDLTLYLIQRKYSSNPQLLGEFLSCLSFGG